ncbi:hypothetical protein [Prevotella intermedia]|uniref:Uncharacterized protein n=1 Tax=Prevotella intermedia TaxID=28131 RepID=A0A2G9IF81_PREIN|nr:hypothetical protein [Prevotella intermedia]PIN28431.1 hypothetical protein CUC04_02855 [Prevotella intermedia]
MKHTRVYEQPTSTTIHIISSNFTTTSPSTSNEVNNNSVNRDGNIEIGSQIEEGEASGAHAKLLDWEE